jgi:hypothetical protein
VRDKINGEMKLSEDNKKRILGEKKILQGVIKQDNKRIDRLTDRWTISQKSHIEITHTRKKIHTHTHTHTHTHGTHSIAHLQRVPSHDPVYVFRSDPKSTHKQL